MGIAAAAVTIDLTEQNIANLEAEAGATNVPVERYLAQIMEAAIEEALEGRDRIGEI